MLSELLHLTYLTADSFENRSLIYISRRLSAFPYDLVRIDDTSVQTESIYRYYLKQTCLYYLVFVVNNKQQTNACSLPV